MIVYYKDDVLYKYINSPTSTNPLGGFNAGWCYLNTDASLNEKFTVETTEEWYYEVMFNLNDDIEERNDLLSRQVQRFQTQVEIANTNAIKAEIIGKIAPFLEEHGSFIIDISGADEDCSHSIYQEAYPAYLDDNVWGAWLEYDEWVELMNRDACGWSDAIIPLFSNL